VPAAGPLARLAGLELGWGGFYRGRFYQTTANDPDNLVGAFRSMDLALGYGFGRVRARLNVTNVTNAVGYTSSFGVYEPLWVRRALFSLATTF
jgi:iron complex outermembrane receptor protein